MKKYMQDIVPVTVDANSYSMKRCQTSILGIEPHVITKDAI